MRLSAALAVLFLLTTGSGYAETPSPPVAAVLDGRLPVDGGQLAIFASQDWSHPLPAIRRVIIVVHGYGRNAADYARNMTALAPAADTLVVAPQFLAPEDVAAHHLSDDVLRWQHDEWSGGSLSDGAIAVSSFRALDAVVAKAGDRAIFPNVLQIVVAGFSAGGQVVQRYAIVSGAELTLMRAGIRERYVVGSPSSYTYFTDERPRTDGTFGPFADAATCPSYNRWKYGLAGDMPPYVAAVAALGVGGLERRYAGRDIVYLGGANDTDPNHRLLDKSCAGEAQGPNRLARLQFFFAKMKQRGGNVFKQRMAVVADAAHNEAKVFGSPCGRAALFDETGCPDVQESK
jgi:pimeloyl-ACP methyl ester carboxylesterase